MSDFGCHYGGELLSENHFTINDGASRCVWILTELSSIAQADVVLLARTNPMKPNIHTR